VKILFKKEATFWSLQVSYNQKIKINILKKGNARVNRHFNMFSHNDHFLASTFSVAAPDKKNNYSNHPFNYFKLAAIVRDFQA
jgi:hypothetical protein